jgi:hypothetical protein
VEAQLVRILLAAMPLMLRSIMTAALAEIPDVIIDEWIGDSKIDTEERESK